MQPASMTCAESQLNLMVSPSLVDLPTELIQEIAYLSFNPDLYLVSRVLKARLYPQRDYLKDMTIILFCDRSNPKSCWYSVSSISWCTSPARRYDLVPDSDMRESLQQRVLSAEIITASRLTSMLGFIFDLWSGTSADGWKRDRFLALKIVVHILCVPTRLLGPQNGDDREELGTILLHDATMDSLNHSIVRKYFATAKPKWMYT